MTRLTFSQRNGLEPSPSPLGIGDLPEQARNLIWSFLYLSMEDCKRTSYDDYDNIVRTWFGSPWCEIARRIHLHFFCRPLDEFNNDFSVQSRILKDAILSFPYNKAFDLLEDIIGDRDCPEDLIEFWADTFESQGLAYRILPEEKIIVPRATEEEDQAISAALHTTKGRYDGAYRHLKKAATFLRDNNPHKSIHESVSAVESVVRVLTGESTFRESMKKIGPKIKINPNLKRGIEALYDYTSDEQGIRHALLEESANVTFDEAQFMLSACAAFVSYSINRHDSVTALQKS